MVESTPKFWVFKKLNRFLIFNNARAALTRNAAHAASSYEEGESRFHESALEKYTEFFGRTRTKRARHMQICKPRKLLVHGTRA